MEQWIREQRPIPIKYEADVLVAGGGLGGVAAAVAAARAGATTILMERNGFPGGVATAGMCCSVFHCLATRERTIRVKGIALEIVDLLAEKAGPGANWRAHKGHVIYDVEKAKLALLELLREAGVNVLLESPLVDAIMEGEDVRCVISADADGAYAIRARTFVDATGEDTLAFLAGAPLNDAVADGRQSPNSYVFRFGGVDTDAFVQYFREHPDQYAANMDIEWTLAEATRQYDENGTFLFPHGGGIQMELVRHARERGDLRKRLGVYDTLDAMQMHLLKATGSCHVITGFMKLASLRADDVSAAILDGRRMADHMEAFFRAYMPGFENAYVSANADDLGIRASRWLDSGHPFTAEMKKTPHRCQRAIGVGVVEEHIVMHAGKGAWSAQVFGNDVYEIPLDCLLPQGVRNLIVGTGRGADSQPGALLRVMAVTMVVGQGAGTAAALAARRGEAIRALPYGALRAELIRQGVEFPEGRVKKA